MSKSREITEHRLRTEKSIVVEARISFCGCISALACNLNVSFVLQAQAGSTITMKTVVVADYFSDAKKFESIQSKLIFLSATATTTRICRIKSPST